MDKPTFDRITREQFVRYVDSERLLYGLPKDEPAALVVDGHGSRYNIPTLRFLKQNHIDLLVLPAHSSHVLQPMDLSPNRIIKDKYRKEYTIAESRLKKKMKKEKTVDEDKMEVDEKAGDKMTSGDDPEDGMVDASVDEHKSTTSKHGRKSTSKKKASSAKKASSPKKASSRRKAPSGKKALPPKKESPKEPLTDDEGDSFQYNMLTLADRRKVMIDAAVNSVMSALMTV